MERYALTWRWSVNPYKGPYTHRTKNTHCPSRIHSRDHDQPLNGVLDLSALASGAYDLSQTFIHLGPSGSIASGTGTVLTLPRLTVAGIKVPSGVYDSSAAWLSAGRVTVGTPATVISVR